MSEDVVLTIEKVADAMGDDAAEFLAIMPIIQDMIENPENYHGAKATMEAVRLAALRTKCSVKAQYYKTVKPTSEVDQLTIRRRKDVLMSLYSALEENINALKLAARIDAKMAGILS